ncbi:MAG: hypothetical protein MJZ29_10455 [Bacteroidaceae bacterium]|nr:hypothetical protein [Bacteroidaceae bacterium]
MEENVEKKPSLKDVIRSQAREDERPNSATQSLKNILAGDFFTTESVRRQLWLILLIVFFVIVYVAMRYNVQQDLIKIDNLKKELVDAKYRALAAQSQLTEKCRESNVLRLIKEGPDSAVHVANQPPFLIEIPEGE